MKAAVLVSPRKIEIQDVEIPKIESHEVLVKLKFCGICTLEQRLYSGAKKLFYPITPGHEASGEVVEVGTDVPSEIKPGHKVALDLVKRCGECYYCRIGQSNFCLNRFNNKKRLLGGFGEYVAVNSKQVFVVSDTLDLSEAALAEPLACCIRSLKKINLSLAEDLLVFGAGSMGLMHLQAALCMGSRVFISDPDKKRLKKAEELGAFLTVDPANEDLIELIKSYTDGRGVDACVVTSPADEALNSSVRAISNAGRINIYTAYNDKPGIPMIPMDANTLHRYEYMITGSEGRTEHDFLQAVRLISYSKVDVASLISAFTTFETIEEGMESALSGETYRVMLDHEALK